MTVERVEEDHSEYDRMTFGECRFPCLEVGFYLLEFLDFELLGFLVGFFARLFGKGLHCVLVWPCGFGAYSVFLETHYSSFLECA